MNLDDDTKLARLLHEKESAYLEDAGFTARVMAALPPAKRRHPWRRSLLVLAATALGCALVALFSGPALASLGSWTDSASTAAVTEVTILGSSISVLALVVFLAGCAIAVWSVRDEFFG